MREAQGSRRPTAGIGAWTAILDRWIAISAANRNFPEAALSESGHGTALRPLWTTKGGREVTNRRVGLQLLTEIRPDTGFMIVKTIIVAIVASSVCVTLETVDGRQVCRHTAVSSCFQPWSLSRMV